VRKDVRALVEAGGGFVLVHVATPLGTCEERDRKGLHAKARAGLIREFTGISDPYEAPKDAEVVVDTTDASPEEAAQEILLHLEREGYIAGAGPTPGTARSRSQAGGSGSRASAAMIAVAPAAGRSQRRDSTMANPTPWARTRPVTGSTKSTVPSAPWS
jgi:hypothetical protein